MKSLAARCLFGLGVGFFCGYVIISVGLGAAFPSLYKAATPIVCGKGQRLEAVLHRYSWRPGAVMQTATIYLIDESTGKKENCTGRVKLAAGAVYGLGIFVLLVPALCRRSSPPAAAQAYGGRPAATGVSAPAPSIHERLAKLNKLRESELISSEEYEQKKADILRDL
jgi:hypothetical protein